MINPAIRLCRSIMLLAPIAIALAGCGGGSSFGPSTSGLPVASATVSRVYPSTGGAISIPSLNGFTGTLNVPEPTGSIPSGTTVTVTSFAGAAANVPALPAADSLLSGPTATTPIYAVSFSPSGTVSLTASGSVSPGASLFVPASEIPGGIGAGHLAAQAALFVPNTGSGTVQVATLQCGISLTTSGAQINYAGAGTFATLQPGVTYTIEFFLGSSSAGV